MTNHSILKLAIISFALFLNTSAIMAQNINANQLIDATINYHDPQRQWQRFNDTLVVEMTTPKQAARKSTVVIDLKNDYFNLKAVRNNIETAYILDKNDCTLKLNGNARFTDADAKTHNLNCDRALFMKNYYTYLYGLPMKIKDPGTIIHNNVKRTTFKGKAYLKLQVSYTKAVGSDAWFFYFNPQTYAMEVYQFFRTNDNGDIIEDSGEYILLSGETTINGIKMPKVRKWFYNKDDTYLGTDTLLNTGA